MTYEEKKAIEFVKSELQDEKIARNDYQSLSGLYGNLEIEIVLNIIEKQSKEIEELKNGQIDFWISDKEIEERIRKKFPVTITKEELKEKNRQEKMRIVQLENEITARIEDVNKYFTPNDKIKAKIEDILNSENSEAIEKLIEWQSLLEKE